MTRVLVTGVPLIGAVVMQVLLIVLSLVFVRYVLQADSASWVYVPSDSLE